MIFPFSGCSCGCRCYADKPRTASGTLACLQLWGRAVACFLPTFFDSYRLHTRLPLCKNPLITNITSRPDFRRHYIPATDMSFRGGRRGGLKGASWEHDPTIKLDSAPSELFPVGECCDDS